jgi:argininosuccinate lyase
MTRLWDKGTPLDARVLVYTAGDDYLLDNRLVAYDIRASIAHAEMLGEQGLLSATEVGAIREALTTIGAEHAQGAWRITLEDGDRDVVDQPHRCHRRSAARRSIAQRSSAGGAAFVPA